MCLATVEVISGFQFLNIFSVFSNTHVLFFLRAYLLMLLLNVTVCNHVKSESQPPHSGIIFCFLCVPLPCRFMQHPHVCSAQYYIFQNPQASFMRDLTIFQSYIGVGTGLHHLLNTALLIPLTMPLNIGSFLLRAYSSIYSLTLLSCIR